MIAPSVKCKLIGICGHARSGKDTVGQYLNQTRPDTYKLAFAGALKAASAAMFGIDLDKFYDDELKEHPDPVWNVSPRKIAQFFGTEMVRDTLDRLIPGMGANFWVQRMAHTLNGQCETVPYEADDVVVITDVRFQNEYDWIIENGGIIIHLTRPGAEGTVGIPSHQSEAGISFTDLDNTYGIVNNGTLEELYEEVARVITQANIYPFSNPELY